MRSISKSTLLNCVLLAVAASPLPADTIGLCNTGFTSGCGALASNQVAANDGNYTLPINPQGTGAIPFVVLAPPARPDPVGGPWLPDTNISQWIGPMANQQFGNSGCCVSGLFTYRIQFSTTLPNDVVQGRWASDNNAAMILDGTITESLSGSFSTWTSFMFTVANANPHTLDFQVTNTSNATGLRVEFDAPGAAGTPEPATMGLFGAGLLSLGLLCKRSRKAPAQQ